MRNAAIISEPRSAQMPTTMEIDATTNHTPAGHPASTGKGSFLPEPSTYRGWFLMCPRAADTKRATNRIRPMSRMTPAIAFTAISVTAGRARASIRDLEKDAPSAVAGLRGRLRRCRFVEPEDVLDLGFQVAGRHQLGELLEDRSSLGGSSHPLRAHTPRGCRLRIRHARDGDQDAARLEQAQGARGDLTAHGIDHDVDIVHSVLDIGGGVIDDLVGADRAHVVDVGSRGGGDDRCALPVCELDRERSDATRAALDEDALAGLEVRAAEEREPGGDAADMQGRSLLEGDAVRDLRDGRDRCDRKLGIRARAAPEGPVSSSETRDSIAERVNGAGEIEPGRGRKRDRHVPLHVPRPK